MTPPPGLISSLACTLTVSHNFADTVDDWRALDCGFQMGKLRLPPWQGCCYLWLAALHWNSLPLGVLSVVPPPDWTFTSYIVTFSPSSINLWTARIASGGLLSSPNASLLLPWNVRQRHCKSVVRVLKGWLKFSRFTLSEIIDSCVKKDSIVSMFNYFIKKMCLYFLT